MKIAVLVVRVLLGAMFCFFGANLIFHFITMPPQPPSDAATYGKILAEHGVMRFVGSLMLVAGVLLLVGRFVPIALVILGPILVTILIFHLMLGEPAGVGAGAVATVMEVFLIYGYRRSFAGLFEAAPVVG